MIPNEDELDELPPIDGETRDEPENDPDPDLLEESAEDASLDDATDEDAPADASDLDLDRSEGGWLGEAGEAPDLDLGDVAITDFGEEGSALADAEETSTGDDDLALEDAPERGGLDTGDEGPLDADEELSEADLPALDADEEGELDDGAVVDAGFASDEPVGLPWAARPWSMVGAPTALAGATAVACAHRGALVAARSESGATELVGVDLEGTSERLPAEGLPAAEVRALSVDATRVAAVVQDGRLLLSSDGGGRFAPIGAPMASDALFALGRLWVRTRAGGLIVLGTTADSRPRSRPSAAHAGAAGDSDLPASIERCPVPGIAAALTCEATDGPGAVAVLVVDDGGRPTALLRTTGEAWIRREAGDAPEACSPALFAVRGEHVAYAARRGGVVRGPGGGPWQLVEWDGRITALAFVDDAGTLIASTYFDADDTTALVRLDSAGKVSMVARIGAAHADLESDGRVASMAYDEARGVVWVAGGFGLAAFAMK
jgi:hypothetical protein